MDSRLNSAAGLSSASSRPLYMEAPIHFCEVDISRCGSEPEQLFDRRAKCDNGFHSWTGRITRRMSEFTPRTLEAE